MRHNISRALELENIKDIKKIRKLLLKEIPDMSFGLRQVEAIWRAFSNSLYARWLIPDKEILKLFKAWIQR